MTLSIFADGVENVANLARIADAARILGGSCVASPNGRLIAVENAPGARDVYGRRRLREDATLAVGNERRGLSRRILASADETVVIPTVSRTVTTLNVAAAAAVAGWYLLNGSGAQRLAARPENRRPGVLLVGDDHVEVGSALRSTAAFGFHDILLEDRGAGWFDGSAARRREARAAARRHKNPLRIRRAALGDANRFEEIVLVVPSGKATLLQHVPLAHGRHQLVVMGAEPDELAAIAQGRLRIASLELQPFECIPLRFLASIALAEIARQVGRRRPGPSRPAARPPTYGAALQLMDAGDLVLVDPSELLAY